MRLGIIPAVLASLIFAGTLRADELIPLFGTGGTPASLHDFDFAPPGPQVRNELSVKRADIFDFAVAPTVTRAGDRIDINFQTKAYCDATVAIESSNGKIVRHLASGVLGDNAPAPFAKNTTKQHLIWDGKDDFGVFIDDKDALTVRVSLGLKAMFEKNLHCNPMQVAGPDPIIHSAPDGVYVYTHNVNYAWDYLQQFDHDAHYVKTLYPFSAATLSKIKGLEWVYVWPEERKIPAKEFDLHGSLLPFRSNIYESRPLVGDFTVRDGWITLLGNPTALRLGTDDTTRGQDLVTHASTLLSTIKHVVLKSFARRSTASPDGHWIYLTCATASRGNGDDDANTLGQLMDHAVYRMPADCSANPEVFLGDPQKSGSDNAHFNTPSGIAVDPQGRIYVSDWDNDRVQVFSPEGKFVRTIPVVGPADISINQKTGEIYVFSWLLRWKVTGYAAEVPQMWRTGPGQDGDYNRRGTPVRVQKFKPLDQGAGLVYEQKLLYDGKPMEMDFAFAPWSRADVDGWGPHPMIWVTLPMGAYGAWTHLVVFKEENNALTLQCDFDKECEKQGVLTNYRAAYKASPLQRQFLYFDPKHQVLYVGEPNDLQVKYFTKLLAIDVATGRERIIQLPFEAADAAIDDKGRIYLLNDDFVGRFDLDTWAEVPFDYGKKFGPSGKIVSVVQTIGGHYSSYKHQSLGVSPQGDVIVAGYKEPLALDRRKDSAMAVGLIPWHPTVFPGRPSTNVCVNVFNTYGELIHEDVLAGIGVVTGGLSMDWNDNIYAAIPGARVLDGRPVKFNTGTLAKFAPDGGRITTDSNGALAPLDKRPDTPAPMKGNGGENLWVQGAKWLFGGTPNGLMWLNCNCRQARFKTDYFGRSFVPESWRYSVAVLDTAGNVMLRIGQYGNVDSSGPKSLVPLGGDEIGLVDAQFVAVDTDKRLFIGDMANARIVSALLGYHTEQRIALKEIPDESKK